ncbi:hypothetical protein GCM10019016_051140 [Streptomyces prasinosporus]|uniref:Uncharacterized protein n=1 Tax=Streptomyces prasinosporus TaxID=68256 RepID=A0ABP6TV55_9ACTN
MDRNAPPRAGPRSARARTGGATGGGREAGSAARTARHGSPARDAVSRPAPAARLTPGREERTAAVTREIRTKGEATVPAGGGAVHRRWPISATQPSRAQTKECARSHQPPSRGPSRA